LVEDEHSVRSLAAEALAQQGYRVIEAQEGVEALKVSAKHRGGIDLLVTDVVMPQMGGRELAELIRVCRPEIKVLFTSGYTDDAIVRHGVLQADMAFLQKPFSPQRLSSKVREVLDAA
jgi:two-component system, cell cycle sensor histidine kinase and response regulator CckA